MRVRLMSCKSSINQLMTFLNTLEYGLIGIIAGPLKLSERVLDTNVEADNAGSHTFTTTVTPPANATLNTVLTMRVISNMNSSPVVCSNNFAGRADDYGVYVSTTLGNEAVSALQLKIYPNPVQDEL